MWHYYGKAERQINISGPLTYPWGPKRPRYPYRAHELNDAGKLLAKGCEAIGIEMDRDAARHALRAACGARRAKVPPCAYRGFCRFGCTTNAKRSALTVWIPSRARRGRRGARSRDGRADRDGRTGATGVHYHREGAWRFQRAKQRRRRGLCGGDAAAAAEFGQPALSRRLANSSGLVGKNLMTQSNQAVWGRMDEDPCAGTRGHPRLAITEHWNYDDNKDFFGGYCWMGQGPLPIEWAAVQTGRAGCGARRCASDAALQPHDRRQDGRRDAAQRGQPGHAADDLDQYGLRVARITYKWGDNDKALIAHALEQMGRSIAAIGAKDMFARRTTPIIWAAPRAWATTRAQRGRRRLPQLGHSPICGFATDRCSRRSAA
jgi:hypothetical protein